MAVEITLSPDQEASFKNYIYTLVVDEVISARTAVHLGIANNTLDKWIEVGLPMIHLWGVIRVQREEIDKWLRNYSKAQQSAV